MSVDLIDLGLGLALIAVLLHNMALSRKVDRLMYALRDSMPAIEAFSEAVDRSERAVAEFSKAGSVKGGAISKKSYEKPDAIDLPRRFFEMAEKGDAA